MSNFNPKHFPEHDCLGGGGSNVRRLDFFPDSLPAFSAVLGGCYLRMAESSGTPWSYIPDEIVKNVLLPKASPDYLWKRAHGGMYYWFYELNGEVVGTIGLNRKPSARYDSTVTKYRVEQIAVLPDYRSYGIGRSLMNHALNFARGQGMEVFMFAPVPFHDVLLRMGFEHFPERDYYLPQDVEAPAGFNERWLCDCVRRTLNDSPKLREKFCTQKWDCHYLEPKG